MRNEVYRELKLAAPHVEQGVAFDTVWASDEVTTYRRVELLSSVEWEARVKTPTGGELVLRVKEDPAQATTMTYPAVTWTTLIDDPDPNPTGKASET